MLASAAAAGSTRGRSLLRLAVGLGISALFIWLSLRGTDLHQIRSQIEAADYWYLVPYFAFLLAMHLVRTIRWGILLAPLEKLPFRRLNAISAVGFMALLVLPLRLGEFVRPYLVRVPGRVSGTSAMASIVIERVIDGLIMAAMLSVLLLRIPVAGPEIAWIRRGGMAVFFFFLAVLVSLVVAYRQKEPAQRFIQVTIGRVSPSIAQRLCNRLESFIRGLKAVPSARSLATVVVLTLMFWGLNGLGTIVLALAFDIHLTLFEAYLCLCIRVIGVMLPTGPGMVGTYQAFTQLGLTLFVAGAQGARGAAYANVLWASQFAEQVALGLIFMGSKDLAVDHHRVTLGELIHAEDEVAAESQKARL
jgi:glycosyltransferase 2 family protein